MFMQMPTGINTVRETVCYEWRVEVVGEGDMSISCCYSKIVPQI